eukprot:gene150-203_t
MNNKINIHLTDAAFDHALQASNTVLVSFWAPWCGPCRMLAPIIEEIAEEYHGKAAIYRMNIDENSVIPTTYNIRSIPTLIIFKKGQAVERMVGVLSKVALEEKLNIMPLSGVLVDNNRYEIRSNYISSTTYVLRYRALLNQPNIIECASHCPIDRLGNPLLKLFRSR